MRQKEKRGRGRGRGALTSDELGGATSTTPPVHPTPPANPSYCRLEGGAKSFRYLSQTGTYTLADVDDGDGLRATLGAASVIGLEAADVDALLAVVAAVLHLGNVEFAADGEGSKLAGKGASAGLANAAALLRVPGDGLLTALTTRAIEVGGERIVKRLDVAAACESRDSLAKTLYARVFDWIVAAVNRRISALGAGAGRTARTIGILDIYGFECFDENSFEQLCINLANERLQQQFNAHVFKGEQQEYAAEGIDWSYIEFVDNQDCLDLLEGGGGAEGVFPLIDEACRLPRATYQASEVWRV